MCIKLKLTVFFESPFWVGAYEKFEDNSIEVAKLIFGAEPKDNEIYDLFLKKFSILRFSPALEVEKEINKKINPKRVLREINAQISAKGIGTKAQQALKLQQEECKKERRQFSKQRRETEEQRKFEMKQIKKKQKHKGR